MKNKKRFLFMLATALLITSETVSPMAMTKGAGSTETESPVSVSEDVSGEEAVEEVNPETDVFRVNAEAEIVLAEKEKEDTEGKKEKTSKKSKKKKKKNKKKKNKSKKKKNKKKNKKKKDKRKKKKKKDKMNDKNNMDIKEEEIEKIPETDKYKPEIKDDNNGKTTEDKEKPNEGNLVPGGGYIEKPSTDYTLFCENTDKKGRLKFRAEAPVTLPEKGFIGLKANGENSGKETEIVWSGSGISDIKKGIKGNYTLIATSKENLIIGGKDYGTVKFAVDIIVE